VNGPSGTKNAPPPKDEAAVDDGFGNDPFPTASAAATSPEDQERIAGEIDEIRKEGLTGRQLRMARRLALKHGLAPVSDYDAVRLLRAKGIDPFQRANLLELVVPDKPKSEEPASDGEPQRLPQTITRATAPALPQPSDSHVAEIEKIQQDIARRRRARIRALIGRLTLLVALPTFIAGWYFNVIATPMYATKSEFVIQQAEAQSGGGLGGLLSGTGFATSQDSITVQSYLQSRDAMLRLDADIGFRAHFSNPDIDAIQRLDPDASNEDAYKLFKRHVKIGYDPTEGIIKMEVIAADPEVSAEFSRALIGYAEEQVDQMTQRMRARQMDDAQDSFAEAEDKMMAAQARVLELQEQLGVLDPVSETSSLMGQISSFEVQLAEKRLQLQQLLDNTAPNQARVSGVEGDIKRLEELVATLRAQLTEDSQGAGSLASTTSRLRMAEVELETRTMMMQEALTAVEASRLEANRQVRYLSLGVTPVPPDEPTYPRAFENTMVALLIFGGFYLMASLTLSILREQVSS
jgi:capsular polysaccharide transport system permease protein